MQNHYRRRLVQAFAFGLASGMTTRLWANELTGYNVAPATEFLSTIPRKTGDPLVFTYALDKSPIKATTGGWARDVTVKDLPIATGIAGAHLYINAGGAREMHMHHPYHRFEHGELLLKLKSQNVKGVLARLRRCRRQGFFHVHDSNGNAPCRFLSFKQDQDAEGEKPSAGKSTPPVG